MMNQTFTLYIKRTRSLVACCKVAHMAGAAKYFELLEDDDEHDPYGPVPAGALMARLVDITSGFGRVVESG